MLLVLFVLFCFVLFCVVPVLHKDMDIGGLAYAESRRALSAYGGACHSVLTLLYSLR